MDAATFGAQWAIKGVVNEKRELTSAKTATWRGYLVKVATLGNAFEVSVTKEQYDSVEEQQHRAFGGELDNTGNRLRLVCKTIGPDVRAKATAAAA
jgi:hypothetical protein